MQMSVVPRKAAAVVLVRPSPTVSGLAGPTEALDRWCGYISLLAAARSGRLGFPSLSAE
jgi:hypothetical protein